MTYVAVEPHSVLQERVWGIFNTRRHGARRESGLLDITVIVFWVLVQDQAANVMHWELATRPNLGNIERIEAQLLWVCFLGLHDLDLGRPLDLLSALDSVP